MWSRSSWLLVFLAPFVSGSAAPSETKWKELDPARISAVAAMLPAQPAGFGRPIDDRAFWDSPAVKKLAGSFTGRAGQLLTEPFPAWDPEKYLDFSRTGKRQTGEAMLRARDKWLLTLVMAEGAENQGRFVPRILEVLEDLVAQPTWSLPAHDRKLDNFHRRKYEVDLRSAETAGDLAQALYLLGNRVPAATRQRVLAAMETQVFAPVRKSLRDGSGSWWLGRKDKAVQNNWNTVCLAGVVGAALAVLPDKSDRAVFAAAGEHYSRYFMNAFRSDGYCDEGYGYWVYGFTNMIVLRELLFTATGGKIDLFRDKKTAAVAMYGVRAIMRDDRVPNFADCRSSTRINRDWVGYCNRALNLGFAGFPSPEFPGKGRLATVFMPTSVLAGAAPIAEGIGPRTFFDQAGVLISRPGPEDPGGLAIAIKAGGNGSHNHNDVGSFVLVHAGEIVAGDPGGPHFYTSETFGPKRYENPIFGSFGHPVPRVAGHPQIDATTIHPAVLETGFTEAMDHLRIDMKPAYKVDGLKKLERAMHHRRGNGGAVAIVDTMDASVPLDFETAVPCLGEIERVDAAKWIFKVGKARMQVVVDSPSAFSTRVDPVNAVGLDTFQRLSVKLNQPAASARIQMVFTPVP